MRTIHIKNPSKEFLNYLEDEFGYFTKGFFPVFGSKTKELLQDLERITNRITIEDSRYTRAKLKEGDFDKILERAKKEVGFIYVE